MGLFFSLSPVDVPHQMSHISEELIRHCDKLHCCLSQITSEV